ncbi:MAG: hypothetical protein ACF8R7_11675 [Phycisphaerales bacterium JB039]
MQAGRTVCAALLVAAAASAQQLPDPDELPPSPCAFVGGQLIRGAEWLSGQVGPLLHAIDFGNATIYNEGEPGAPTWDEIGASLDRAAPVIALAEEAAQCDDLHLGITRRVWKLTNDVSEVTRVAGRMRLVNLLLRADALRHERDGALDSAASRLETALLLCRATQKQPASIFQTSRAYWLEFTLDDIARLAARNELTEPQRQRLLDAINRFDAWAPLGVAQQMQAEVGATAQYLRLVGSGPEAGRHMDALIAEHGLSREHVDRMKRFVESVGADAEAARKFAENYERLPVHDPDSVAIIAIGEEDLQARIDEAEGLVRRLAAVWASPGEEEAVEAIREAMRRDESQIARLLCGRSLFQRDARDRVVEALRAAREALQAT